MEQTIKDYLLSVPPKFKDSFNLIRETILDNLPEGYQEQISYKMLGYVVPLAVYPPGYLHKGKLPLPIMNLGYLKHHIALYHYGVYGDESLYEWFIKEYSKLNFDHPCDIGKSCIRFNYMDEIPIDLIAELARKLPVETWVEHYKESTARKSK